MVVVEHASVAEGTVGGVLGPPDFACPAPFLFEEGAVEQFYDPLVVFVFTLRRFFHATVNVLEMRRGTLRGGREGGGDNEKEGEGKKRGGGFTTDE
jgi:hypothetical protein